MTPAEEAELQNRIATLRSSIPAMIELSILLAQVTRARYIALVKEGFTSAEAIEICKGPII